MNTAAVLLITVLCQAPPAPAAQAPPAQAAQPGPAAGPRSLLDPFRAMAGVWQADITGDGTPDTEVDYRVIANGSAVVETLFRDTPYEMITVYHMDGPRLVCTHYCAARNQPRLEAKSMRDGAIAFEFVDATNMASQDDLHMNAVRFTFIDADHVTSSWSSKAKGVAGDTKTFVMSRKAAPKGT